MDRKRTRHYMGFLKSKRQILKSYKLVNTNLVAYHVIKSQKACY